MMKKFTASRDFETDAWEEKFLRTVRPQIQFIASHLKTIVENLEKRDLSGVTTQELIELLMKHFKLLQEESGSVGFREDWDDGFGGTDTDPWRG